MSVSQITLPTLASRTEVEFLSAFQGGQPEQLALQAKLPLSHPYKGGQP